MLLIPNLNPTSTLTLTVAHGQRETVNVSVPPPGTKEQAFVIFTLVVHLRHVLCSATLTHVQCEVSML